MDDMSQMDSDILDDLQQSNWHSSTSTPPEPFSPTGSVNSLCSSPGFGSTGILTEVGAGHIHS
jgi:hypothetical protein